MYHIGDFIKMKNIIILLLLSIFMFSCAEKEKPTLVVGTNPAFPPFEYISHENEIVGFDIELANKIAEEYNANLIIKEVDFASLLLAIESGDIDIAISGMTITDERKKIVDFSTPYYEASQVALRRKDDTRFQDLKTKYELVKIQNIGVQSATTGQNIAREFATAGSVIEFKSAELAVGQLLNKNIDVIIIDKEPAKTFMSKHNNIAIMPISFDTEYYGIAVNKDNRELLSSINTTIANLVNSGEYSQLVEKYITSYLAQ